jgi:hypothetical protein
MTISLRLNFVIDEASCATTLKKMTICRLCFFICVIIVCQFSCVDEIMREIIEYCMKAKAAAKTKATARTMTTTKITTKAHRIDSDDADRDADSDDVDSRCETLF